ncbi:MAG: insulinase family protein [Alishewanella aestuarii]
MASSPILQSPNDPRQYRHLVLANGLTVLLVQQADSEKSAAALTVNVGHFDDPIEREGLAHFLEHMLFLGSAAYPQAGELQQFISEHGGSHNAWTGTEHSQFYFDLEQQHFADGLSRFAAMFTAPLFSSDYVEKERQAIEAEFSLKLKDDSRRIYQVHKESINPAHPFAKFSVGNAQTLADQPHESLQQAVKRFFDSQYSAQRMSLCLVGPQSLTELQQLATRYFSAIKGDVAAKSPLQVPLYLAEHQGLQLTIRPHKSSQRLVVSFALPDIQPWYRYKIVSFLAHLLGDEGPGSLLALLKAQGLVNQLSAGGGIDGSNYKDFTLAFELTQLGRQQYQQVVQAVFAKLRLLKQSDFPEQLFKERQKLLQWAYQFYEPATALQTAMDLSLNLQHYPLQDVIFGDYRMEPPPLALYQQLLSYFNAANLRLMLIADDVTTDRQARWYHTPYQLQAIDQSLLAALAQTALLDGIQLPEANPYLHADLTLLSAADHLDKPELFYTDPGLSLWYKADTDFHSPKGHIFIQLSLPNSCQTLQQQAASRLWVELLLDRFNQQLYAATTAGLNYFLHVHRQGHSLQTNGLSANQLRLVADLLAQLPDPQFCPQRFAELKQQLCRHWLNSSKNKPVATLFSKLSAVLQPQNPEPVQLATALAALSYADFQQFRQQVWQALHLEALLLGNWSRTDALALQQLLQHWQRQQGAIGQALKPQQCLIRDLGPVWLENPPDSPSDHALVIYLPAREKSPVMMALFMLANHILSPRYFHQLRTEQQLGYLVGTGYVPVNTLPGMAFYIQSPNQPAGTLYQATVAFFRQFISELNQLHDSDFQSLKQGLAAQLAERDISLSARAKRYWLALSQGDYSFDLTQQILNALQDIDRLRFQDFLKQLLAAEYDVLLLATDPPPADTYVKCLHKSQLTELLQQQQKCF